MSIRARQFEDFKKHFNEDFEDFKADILSLYKRVFLRPKTRSFSNLLQEFYEYAECLPTCASIALETRVEDNKTHTRQQSIYGQHKFFTALYTCYHPEREQIF